MNYRPLWQLFTQQTEFWQLGYFPLRKCWAKVVLDLLSTALLFVLFQRVTVILLSLFWKQVYSSGIWIQGIYNKGAGCHFLVHDALTPFLDIYPYIKKDMFFYNLMKKQKISAIKKLFGNFHRKIKKKYMYTYSI